MLGNGRCRDPSNLEPIGVENGWTPFCPLLENGPLANGGARRIFLTVGQRGTIIRKR